MVVGGGDRGGGSGEVVGGEVVGTIASVGLVLDLGRTTMVVVTGLTTDKGGGDVATGRPMGTRRGSRSAAAGEATSTGPRASASLASIRNPALATHSSVTRWRGRSTSEATGLTSRPAGSANTTEAAKTKPELTMRTCNQERQPVLGASLLRRRDNVLRLLLGGDALLRTARRVGIIMKSQADSIPVDNHSRGSHLLFRRCSMPGGRREGEANGVGRAPEPATGRPSNVALPAGAGVA
jgi:hypothetical protein